MLSYYYNLLYFLYCFSLMLSFLTVYLSLEATGANYLMISLNILKFDFNNMEVVYMLNKSGILFSGTVLLISSFIYVYSYYYSSKSFKTSYYCLLLFIFVISMVYTINCSTMLFVMLGWDGLGFSSYLLICYYMNNVSLSNALFTLMTNRLGDIFMLWFIILQYTNMSNFLIKYMFTLPLLLGLMTKSAIFPFSNWLPAAMSAPTPVSALVHSSTLVTSGLWLMMKNYYYFMNNMVLMKYLMIISLFVILYSGMNTLYEMDMKKLIALSTLSHMGFICFGISLGLVNLAYLHLMVHALFKSTLFMAMGMIIVNNNHYQDIRFISYGNKLNLFSFSLMYFSVLNLLGMPMMSSYFSKDLMLEMMSFTKNFFFIELLIYIMMMFSFYYSMKLFTYCSNELNNSPYKSMNKINFSLMLSLMMMMSLNICFYKVFVNMILMEYIFFMPVNLANKMLLFSLLILMLGMYLTTNLMNFSKHNYIYYNTMMNLGFATKNIISIMYYKSLNNFLGAEFMYNSFSLLELKAVNVGMMNKLYSMIFIVNMFIYLLILSLLITLIM